MPQQCDPDHRASVGRQLDRSAEHQSLVLRSRHTVPLSRRLTFHHKTARNPISVASVPPAYDQSLLCHTAELLHHYALTT